MCSIVSVVLQCEHLLRFSKFGMHALISGLPTQDVMSCDMKRKMKMDAAYPVSRVTDTNQSMLVLVRQRLRGYIRPSSLFSHTFHQSSLVPRPKNMPVTASSWIPHRYPPTHRSDHIDIYGSEAKGEVKVPDPYAWLERDGEERQKWLASQEALARNFLDAHPDRVRLEEEIRASTDYEKVSFPAL